VRESRHQTQYYRTAGDLPLLDIPGHERLQSYLFPLPAMNNLHSPISLVGTDIQAYSRCR
jgi:hypothetical protein